MERYLFALDIDGTLLNDKKNISHKTKKYLHKLTKQGHIIVLASGRPSRSMYRYYNELKLTSPLICYNGAYTFSPKDTMFPKIEFKFPRETVKALSLDIREYIQNIMCETDTEIWVDKDDRYLDKFFWYDKMSVHRGELTKILDKDPMTMIGKFHKSDDSKDIIINAVNKYPEISVRFWTGSPYFELYCIGTSKGASIAHIAKYYHIDKEHIVVFGDAMNDLEMFEVAGKSIAMKNSKDKFKEKADYVSLGDNNHNGIYHTIKALLKGDLI